MSDKPKALRYAADLADAVRRIAEALPDMFDGLITRARDGDTRAAVYLLDRIMGRTAGAKAAPADDREPPYTEDAFRLDQSDRDSKDRLRRLLAGIGAEGGA